MGDSGILGVLSKSPKIAEELAQLTGKNAKDIWAEAHNSGNTAAFNTAKSPYDVWSGQYTQIRPRGATFMHPEGIDAAWKAAGGE
jgi:hypothetical protein